MAKHEARTPDTRHPQGVIAKHEDRMPDAIRSDKEPQKEPHWARRAMGQVVKSIGNGFKAKFGDQASDLQSDFHHFGDMVGGKTSAEPEVDPGAFLLRNDPRWRDFKTRATVTREFGNKVIEVMQPVGWALLVNVPLGRAQELLEIVSRELSERESWRSRLMDCKGYLQDLSQAAETLAQQEASADKQQVDSARRRALWALDSLVGCLDELVDARDVYVAERK